MIALAQSEAADPYPPSPSVNISARKPQYGQPRADISTLTSVNVSARGSSIWKPKRPVDAGSGQEDTSHEDESDSLNIFLMLHETAP